MTEEACFRALIVEDDRNFRRLVEIRLKSWRPDIEITIAETLSEARRVLSECTMPFSLVILDQHLPDGMGATLLDHPRLEESAVLAVSADEAPDLPAQALKGGARQFLHKRQISEPLLLPLLEALVERKQMEYELVQAKLRKSKMDTIRTLLSTLQHEINNPLGAVLGGAYLVRTAGGLDKEQGEAIRLIEESSQRIKHVIAQLCDAAELEEVTKGKEQLYHVPGDPSWERSKN